MSEIIMIPTEHSLKLIGGRSGREIEILLKNSGITLTREITNTDVVDAQEIACLLLVAVGKLTARTATVSFSSIEDHPVTKVVMNESRMRSDPQFIMPKLKAK